LLKNLSFNYSISFRPSKPVSRPVVRNIRNDRNDDKSNRQARGGKAQPKRNVKSSDGRNAPSNKPVENKAPTKPKVDTGRKPKEEKSVCVLKILIIQDVFQNRYKQYYHSLYR